MTIKNAEYHLQAENFSNEHWPNGAWSVYKITGEQIAERTVREKVNTEGGYYEGKVIARHSWCGYIGMFATLAEAVAEIEADQKKA